MKQAIRHILARGNPNRFWIVILGVFWSSFANAVLLAGEVVSKTDMLMLPPVCQRIVNDLGFHGPVNQRMHPEWFDRPEYRMAKNNIHLHHYCWALIEKQRYFRAPNKDAREYNFSGFMGNIKYVLDNSSKDWQYFHVLLVDQAEMLKMRGDYPDSLLKIDEALMHKPDYERAYSLKAKVYLDMGDKNKAIEAAQEGLDKNPRSGLLRWQLEKLGATVPPLPPEDKPEVQNESAGSSGTANGAEVTIQNKGNEVLDGTTRAAEPISEPFDQKADERNQELKSVNASAAKSVPQNESSPVDSAPAKKNPYCRFCP